MKRTPWFDGNVKPVRVGRYERDIHLVDAIWDGIWDGKRWRTEAGLVSLYQHSDKPSTFHWRGLTRPAP